MHIYWFCPGTFFSPWVSDTMGLLCAKQNGGHNFAISWAVFWFKTFSFIKQPNLFPFMKQFKFYFEFSDLQNFCQWLDSNRGTLELEATALPTEPQPLPPEKNNLYFTDITSSSTTLNVNYLLLLQLQSQLMWCRADDDDTNDLLEFL